MTGRDEEDVILVSSESEDEKLGVKGGIADPGGVGTACNASLEGFVTEFDSENGVLNGGTAHLQTANINQDAAFRDEIQHILDGVPSAVPANDATYNNVDNGSQPSTSHSIECIDLDEDIARLLELPSSSTPTVDPNEAIKEEIRNILETFVYSLKKCMTPKEKLKVKDQLWNAFDKIDFQNAEVATEIKAFVDEIIKQSEEKPKSTWRLVRKLLDFLNSRRQSRSRKQNKNKPEDETPEDRAERKNHERIVQLEKQLAKMEKAIEDYGKRDVDLSDEKNSTYLVRTRMINEYMKCYKLICRKTGCNSYTGRPIEKRIALQGITKCAELSEAVEKFMNSKPILFVPDYHDIKKVVSEYNAQARPPPLCDSDIESTAKELFNEVIRIMRSRRRQDMEIVCPVETLANDPAEKDDELQRKLEENTKLRKSEHEVIERFVKEQEENKEDAREVEDDPESSAGESDDEDEEEDLSAEQGSNSGTDEAAQDDQQFTRDQVEEESDSESEDDPPPPKKQRYSPKNSPRKGETSVKTSKTYESVDINTEKPPGRM